MAGNGLTPADCPRPHAQYAASGRTDGLNTTGQNWFAVAPTNDAFEELADALDLEVAQLLTPEYINISSAILWYHRVSLEGDEPACGYDLTSKCPALHQHEDELEVHSACGETAEVLAGPEADCESANGAIYLISKVLIPPSMCGEFEGYLEEMAEEDHEHAEEEDDDHDDHGDDEDHDDDDEDHDDHGDEDRDDEDHDDHDDHDGHDDHEDHGDHDDEDEVVIVKFTCNPDGTIHIQENCDSETCDGECEFDETVPDLGCYISEGAVHIASCADGIATVNIYNDHESCEDELAGEQTEDHTHVSGECESSIHYHDDEDPTE